MSEHQIVAFRAIDGPVSAENLEYMQKQSSRAEITPWAFDNQYHFGDFRGDAYEMLRRGYDIHLHYANFGTRLLLIRLPTGLPDWKAAEPYFEEDTLKFVRDKSGPGGILAIEPYYESGELDELWRLDELLSRLVPLRAEILDGDLRPLYLAHLAVAGDSNHDPEATQEGPLPAGMKNLTDGQQALAELYELSDALIGAAAKESPPLPAQADSQKPYADWLGSQAQATKDAWLARCMADPHSNIRVEMLAAFQKDYQAPAWPTVRSERTIAELQKIAAGVHEEAKRKATAEAAAKRAKMLAGLAADPDAAIRQTEQLAKQRGVNAYEAIANLLADLRDALAGGEQAGLAETQAQKLRKEHPKLTKLIAALRKKHLLPK